MFEDLFALLGSAAGGGLLGLIGTGFKTWQERKEREAQRQHDLEMRKLDQDEMRLEASLLIKQTEAEYAGQLAIAQTEAQAAADIAAGAVQAKSYTHDKATYSKGFLSKMNHWFGDVLRGLLVIVDTARGLMRPGITVFLLYATYTIAYQLQLLVKELNGFTPEQAWPLYMQVINAVVFLTTTAVTWWFGSRPNQPTQ